METFKSKTSYIYKITNNKQRYGKFFHNNTNNYPHFTIDPDCSISQDTLANQAI